MLLLVPCLVHPPRPQWGFEYIQKTYMDIYELIFVWIWNLCNRQGSQWDSCFAFFFFLHGKLLATDTSTHDSDLVQGKKAIKLSFADKTFISCLAAIVQVWAAGFGELSSRRASETSAVLKSSCKCCIVLACCRHRSCSFPGDVRTYAVAPDSLEAIVNHYAFQSLQREQMHITTFPVMSVQICIVVGFMWRPTRSECRRLYQQICHFF